MINGSKSTPYESPAYPVTFARPFAIGRFEVRVREYTACVDEGVCHHPDIGAMNWPPMGDLPRTCVSWDDANTYA